MVRFKINSPFASRLGGPVFFGQLLQAGTAQTLLIADFGQLESGRWQLYVPAPAPFERHTAAKL